MRGSAHNGVVMSIPVGTDDPDRPRLRDRAFTIAGLAFIFVAGLGVGLIVQADPAPSAVAPTSTGQVPSASTSPTSSVSSPAPSPSPTPTPRPSRYTGEVLAYGDSILILAEDCLEDRGFTVDSEESRPVRSGPEELLAYGSALPDRVLIHLGTNGGATDEDYDAIMEVLGPDRVVVFATIQLPDDLARYTFEERTNTAILALPQRYPNVRIFDWHEQSAKNPDLLYADEIHPNPEGCRAYAQRAERVVRAA